MENSISPQEVFDIMWKNDSFSNLLGLEVDEVGMGYCRLHYTVTGFMMNGWGYLHGGVMFSAADSAFAFACNSQGRVSVALDVAVTYTRPVQAGEVLSVETAEVYLGNKTSVYEIKTVNEKGETVCVFRGTAYRT